MRDERAKIFNLTFCKRMLEEGCILYNEDTTMCEIILDENEICPFELSEENVKKLKEWVKWMEGLL